MGKQIQKLGNNHINAYEMIDYLNDIIKDLNIDIEEHKKREQVIVPVARKHEKRYREVFKCEQFVDIDKILITFRPNFNSHKKGSYQDFSFYSLEDLKACKVNFKSEILERYKKLLMRN